jgi:hypothetical protein
MEIKCILDRTTNTTSDQERSIIDRLIKKDGEPDKAWLGAIESSGVQYLFSVNDEGDARYFHAYKIVGDDLLGIKMYRLTFPEYAALLRENLEAVVSVDGKLRVIRTENYHPYSGFSVNL